MFLMSRFIRLYEIQDPSRILFRHHLCVPVISVRDSLFHKTGVQLDNGIIADGPADIFFIEIVRCKGS